MTEEQAADLIRVLGEIKAELSNVNTRLAQISGSASSIASSASIRR